MSYLQLENGPDDFSQAIIAFWFRMPADSLAKAKEAANASDAPLAGVAPLLVFGDALPKYAVAGYSTVVNTTHVTAIAIGGHCSVIGTQEGDFTNEEGHYELGKQSAAARAYVGVNCFGDSNVIEVNLPTNGKPSGSGLLLSQTPHWPGSMTVLFWGSYVYDGSGPLGTGGNLCGGIVDLLDMFPEQRISAFAFPGAIRVSYSQNDYSAVQLAAHPPTFKQTSTVSVAPDKWHHVLLSFDVGGGVTASGAGTLSSGCKQWLAFDDVNIKGQDMRGGQDVSSRGLGDNDIVPSEAGDASVMPSVPSNTIVSPQNVAAGRATGRWPTGGWYIQSTTYPGSSAATYALGSASIASRGKPLGIPATADYVAQILRCEMAEFQMWTGQTLDTSDLANRRLFVDDDGKPVKPAVAEKRLGKPDILLHRSGNWIKGKDTGSLGVDPDGKPIDAGQFDPTGKIRAYRPDPQLGK